MYVHLFCLPSPKGPWDTQPGLFSLVALHCLRGCLAVPCPGPCSPLEAWTKMSASNTEGVCTLFGKSKYHVSQQSTSWEWQGHSRAWTETAGHMDGLVWTPQPGNEQILTDGVPWSFSSFLSACEGVGSLSPFLVSLQLPAPIWTWDYALLRR